MRYLAHFIETRSIRNYLIICIGHKGEDVYTGADDAKYIAKGVYETYKDRNLRYSQVVPFTMTEEKNSGTNLPAQIDIYGGHPGMEYEFLFITKGGGSANKTFLYQQTKACLLYTSRCV